MIESIRKQAQCKKTFQINCKEDFRDDMSGKKLKLESGEDDIQTVQVWCLSHVLGAYDCTDVGSLHNFNLLNLGTPSILERQSNEFSKSIFFLN